MKLSDIFSVTYGNKFDLNKMTRASGAGGINFVGRSSKNLGVTARVSPVEGEAPYEAGLITVSLGGTKLLSAFVQEREFYTAQNVAVLRPKVNLTFEQKIYVCLAIRHNRFRYSAFGREANRTIKSLEIPNISDFPTWIVGLSKVTQEDFALRIRLPEVAIEKFEGRLPLIGAERVPLSELFDACYGTNLELNKLQRSQEGINFVSRTAKNNGVSARVLPVLGVEPIPGGVLTVAGGGSVLATFLQIEPFYSGRDLYYLKPKLNFSVDELLFYCACIQANVYRYSYGRQANRTLRDLRLPAREAIPNWVYGQTQRSALEIEEVIRS